MALIGDTVRIKVEFRDYDGKLIDPTDIQLKVNEKNKKKLYTEPPIQITDSNKIATGTYYYDYQIPVGLSDLVIECSGVYNSKPILTRLTISREWVR
jgi:hypothetical protein